MTYVFPIFLECKEWTLDPYWQEIFENCALNKFPKGIKMQQNGNLLVTTPKGDKEMVSVSGTSLDIFKTMIIVFKEKLGLLSNRDVMKQHKDLIIAKNKIKETYSLSWKQIKSKNVKSNLILNYVLRMQTEHNLSPQDTQKLLNSIKFGFLMRYIDNDNIDYSDGNINNIDVVTFGDGDFYIDYSNCTINRGANKQEFVNTDYLLEQNIIKYVKDFNKSVVVP